MEISLGGVNTLLTYGDELMGAVLNCSGVVAQGSLELGGLSSILKMEDRIIFPTVCSLFSVIS